MIRFPWLLVAKQKRSGVRREMVWSTAGRTELEKGSGSGRMDLSNLLYKCKAFQRLSRNIVFKRVND